MLLVHKRVPRPAKELLELLLKRLVLLAIRQSAESRVVSMLEVYTVCERLVQCLIALVAMELLTAFK
jgi:hypothetical protein